MFDRTQVEKILKLNGIASTAPDEEIKSVLVSARWHENDVDAALVVLRENALSKETHVDTLHKVFRNDMRLRPETVSALLGIEMTMHKDNFKYKKSERQSGLTSGMIFKMALVSLSLSLIFVLASMWYLEMGIFHYTLR